MSNIMEEEIALTFDVASSADENNKAVSRSKLGSWRPDISELDDVVVDGIWTASPGNRIIIQYSSKDPLDRGRDTREWIVEASTLTMPNTTFRLWCPVMGHYGHTDWVEGLRRGYLFKYPDKKGAWKSSRGFKKKRKVVNEEDEG